MPAGIKKVIYTILQEGEKYFNFLGGEKTILSMNYKFDDAWRVTADYNNYDYKRSYNQTSTGLPTDKRFLDKEEYKDAYRREFICAQRFAEFCKNEMLVDFFEQRAKKYLN